MNRLFLSGFTLASAWLLACAGSEPATQDPSADWQIETSKELPGEHCAAGGSRLDITREDVTSTVYVCHGEVGQSPAVDVGDAGQMCPRGGSAVTIGEADPVFVCNGHDGDSVALEAIEPGEICGEGGVSVRVGEGSPIAVCHGASGEAGESVTVVTEPKGDHCEHGGVAVNVAGAATWVCHGAPGVDGQDGQDGESVTVSSEAAGANCPRGGVRVQVGEGGARYVCHGDALVWHELTADEMAQPNSAYVAHGDGDRTLTLPANDALRMGDVLRIVNAGTGAVTITPSAEQIFRHAPGRLAAPTSFVARDSQHFPTTANQMDWMGVASSADGTKLVAANRGGQLYTSTDAGVTWTPRDAARNWWSVASSADGTRLVAAEYNGQLYTSADAGATWTARESARKWWSVASSADGMRLVAAVNDGHLYTSTDAGESWTQRESFRGWRAVASSADGARLVAGAYNGLLYTSADAGVTWTPRGSHRQWVSVASSADGSRLVAAAYDGRLSLSSDAGETWVDNDSSSFWTSVSSSGDGMTLALTVSLGAALVSTDGGATWTPRVEGQWRRVAVSASGHRIVAAAFLQPLFVSGGTGSLVARGPSMLELTYVGQGQFFIGGVEGAVEAP